jgi:hypothetical protein
VLAESDDVAWFEDIDQLPLVALQVCPVFVVPKDPFALLKLSVINLNALDIKPYAFAAAPAIEDSIGI